MIVITTKSSVPTTFYIHSHLVDDSTQTQQPPIISKRYDGLILTISIKKVIEMLQWKRKKKISALVGLKKSQLLMDKNRMITEQIKRKTRKNEEAKLKMAQGEQNEE